MRTQTARRLWALVDGLPQEAAVWRADRADEPAEWATPEPDQPERRRATDPDDVREFLNRHIRRG